jgi:hypothetical protein
MRNSGRTLTEENKMNDHLTPERKKGIGDLMLNPFQAIAGFPALLIGIAAIVSAALIASRTHCFFEGVIDAFIVPKVTEPLWVFIAQGLINWLVPALLIAVSGRLVAKSNFRLIDAFGTQAFARFPYLFVAVLSLLPSFSRYSQHVQAVYEKTVPVPAVQPYDMYIYIIGTILVFASILWAVILMYRAFSVSCNAKGTKAIIYFIVIMGIGELITKLLCGYYDIHLHK